LPKCPPLAEDVDGDRTITPLASFPSAGVRPIMIRTAIGIGVLAILCGVGVILYRHMQTQGDLTQLTPPSLVPTPPKTVPQPNPSPEPAPANPAPVPAPIPVVNPEDRPAQPTAPVPPAPAKQPATEQTGGGL